MKLQIKEELKKLKLPLMNFLNVFIISSIFFFSCKNEIIHPKPESYFRIDYPKKSYYYINDSCPFKFKIPDYGAWTKRFNDSKNCNKSIIFPKIKAEILCDYLLLNDNLFELSESFRKMVYDHSFKSSAIIEKLWVNDSANVYGVAYEIKGNTACNFAFLLTDSISNFFSGQLVFQAYPNYDSLKPSIEFIKKDIFKLIDTFRWVN